MKKRPIIVLTGPTAVGKTALSIKLAKRIEGEIISADSMQVYRGMDIGSAKITKDEMMGVKHHLIDIIEPTQSFNVYDFKCYADKALESVYNNNKIPIIAGGTGFYIQALVYDVDFKDEKEGSLIRKELEECAKENGNEYLHNMLKKIDPESAQSIHPNNVKRVIRAIEFYRLNNSKISLHNSTERKKESPYDLYFFVLTDDRKTIYERIDKRVDIMMENGLLDEVKNLKEKGVKSDMTSAMGLGYRELMDYLSGEISLERAVYLIKLNTRHFAKRQLTWFRREPDVRWIDKRDFVNDDRIVSYIEKECLFL